MNVAKTNAAPLTTCGGGSMFGDPCRGTFKYLTAKYRCTGMRECIMVQRKSALQAAVGFNVYSKPKSLWVTPPPPPPVARAWPVVGKDRRTANPDETKEWRQGQFTLAQCKGACLQHSSCIGVEFKLHKVLNAPSLYCYTV